MTKSPEEMLRRKRSLRSLMLILFLGGVAVLILLVRARVRGPTDADEFLETIAASRADVALVAYTVGADGLPDASDPIVQQNAGEKFPLAAVARIPLLLAYADAVVQGRAKVDEPVSLDAWERHHLNGTDGGAHATALRALGLHVDAEGFSVAPKRDVLLDDVVAAMIQHNDNSAADFVLARLGAVAAAQALLDAGLTNHDPILPTAGFYLAAADADTEAGAKRVLAQGPQALWQTVQAAADRFAKTEAGTPAQRQWLDKHPTPGTGVQALWADQALTQGVASQYATLMAKIATGHYGSAAVLPIVQRHLAWAMKLEGNEKLFKTFGSKGGTSVSIMTEAMFAVPNQGDYAGKTRVVVFLNRRMPSLRWFALVRSYVHQQFIMKLALERAFATKVAATFAAPAAP
ncbi:MAG: serine hydrolase [Deltaproteobacteria bacterium]|nr:serine hydrolase [Deltaproteobacteria bacterium]